MIFFGDFNEILTESEKDIGLLGRENQMMGFREVVDYCGIQILGMMRISSLGKGVAQESTLIVLWKTMHRLLFSRYRSDHNALLLKPEKGSLDNIREKPFKFEPMWLLNA